MSSPNARPKTASKMPASVVVHGAMDSNKTSVQDTIEITEENNDEDFLRDVLNEVEAIDRVAHDNEIRSRRPSVAMGITSEVNEDNQLITAKESDGITYHQYPDSGLSENSQTIAKSMSSTTITTTTSQILTIQAKTIRIEVDSTWGDNDYVGLSGIEILGIDGKAIAISPKYLSCDTSSDVFGGGNGDRKIDNVVNGINNTANDSFMWLAAMPYEKSKKQYLQISFPADKIIVGLR